MEVNGRFWGSLPTAVLAGVDFPYLLYRTGFPNAPTSAQSYRTGLRARSLAGDTKWLWEVLRTRMRPAKKAMKEYLASFGPSTHYFIWSWDDPRPAISNLLARFWRLV